MQFFTIVALALATVAPAFAAPAAKAEAEAKTIEKRDLSIQVCEGPNGSGRCVDYRPIFNQCTAFSAIGVQGYQTWRVGSGTTCLWYTQQGCNGVQSGAVNSPGYEVAPAFWQFNTQSWKCFQ
ncbi:hypothetical protein BKA70DRAFT_1278234 [Coprinopsis sp. MPI-PUGE-AT-0042]|nr:hypothetical protein BKA70DRAFT_1278234 [Coprinopsis sp. MPI-PUGE-AT-0042]